MKFQLFPTILILFLALVGFISNISAQETANKQTQNAEVMGENDRLPFMQSEQETANPEPTSGRILFKTFGAMFLIIGLLFFGAWGVRKYGLFGMKTVVSENAPDLKVMSSVSVASGQTLSIVRFGDKILLVGSTAQSFTLLADEFSNQEIEVYKNPKSVSDLLAEENISFERELNSAQNSLDVWDRGEI